MSTVAQRITRAAENKQMSLVELAEKSQISRSSVQRYASDSTKEIPAGKLSKMAEALKVPNDYLLGTRAFSSWDDIDTDRMGFLSSVKSQMGADVFTDIAEVIYGINLTDPYRSSLSDFTSFVYDFVQYASKQSGTWSVQLKSEWAQPSGKSCSPITDDQIKAAFFNGADPTLTKEEQDAMWDEAKAFIDFKIQQRKRKEN